MNELPKSWRIIGIRDIGNLRYGKGLPTSQLKDTGYPVFGANGIIGFYDEYMYEDEQLLISCRGANSGTINLSPRECFITNNSLVLELPEELQKSRHYLKYALIAADKSQMVTGSAQPQVTIANAEDFKLPFAPLPEQRRVVAKIDSLTGKSRRARDHLDHIPRLVEKYKQAVLAAAFRGDLTREWRAKLGEAVDYRTVFLADVLTDIRYGSARKCDYDGGTTPVLRIPNVQKGKIAFDDIKSANFEEAELRKLRLQPGDMLVIRSNGSLGLVGRSAIVDEAAAGMLFAGYLIRLRFDLEAVLPRYIHLWFQSASMRSTIEGLAKSTSGVNNINSTQIGQLPVKLISLDEQHEIVRRLETVFAWIDRLASEATSARRLIDRLDQTILAKAFRGELVEQDPTDEPASVLLERIRAERMAAPKVKRGRKVKTT